MIQVVTQESSNRFLYILDVLLSSIAKQEYKIVQEEDINQDFPVIAYSDAHPNYSCIHVKPHKLLHAKVEEGAVTSEPFLWKRTPCFLKTNGTIPFDVFAASFWLISRWEEYLPHTKDQHQRFLAASSFAFRNGFLNRPIIDEWIIELLNEINVHWPNSLEDKREFRHTLTVDVDAPFAYLYKSLVSQVGGAAKSILSFQFNLVKERLTVISRAVKDPFDTYADFFESGQKSNIIYFVHVGDKTTHDPATPQPSVMINLLQKISKQAEIGLHPSYYSHEKNEFDIEKNRLERWTKQPIVKSRFHYLKFELPTSIQNIRKAGILEEYSMGYAEEVGFRASTSFSFPFYDLKEDEILDTIIHPFAFMDATYINYKKVALNEALDSMKSMIDTVELVKGTLVSVWHNHSFSLSEGNPEWRKVLYEVMSYIQSK